MVNIIFYLKILRPKNFGLNIVWVEKILGQKELGPKNFLSKKAGRVNPRGRIHDSPPPENSRVKLCWVVVSIDG